MRSRQSGANGLLVAGAAFVAFAISVPPLYGKSRAPVSPEMQIVAPRFIQVAMAAGDRYLAANLSGFRALVATTETMKAENYRILGIVQSDVSWLNPAHEDNYYMAAAILPWVGELNATQYILRRASDARPFDWQPPFYYGFNLLYFLKRPQEGAEWLRVAARHTSSELEQIHLQQLAAHWVTKGGSRAAAAAIQRSLAKETRHRGFAEFLEKRARQMDNLELLGNAADQFRQQFGRWPSEIGELEKSGMIVANPTDPFGLRYIIDKNGMVQVAPVQLTAGGR